MCLMRLSRCKISDHRQATGWNHSKGISKVSIAFASMLNGELFFGGKTQMPMMSKSLTIINEIPEVAI